MRIGYGRSTSSDRRSTTYAKLVPENQGEYGSHTIMGYLLFELKSIIFALISGSVCPYFSIFFGRPFGEIIVWFPMNICVSRLVLQGCRGQLVVFSLQLREKM